MTISNRLTLTNESAPWPDIVHLRGDLVGSKRATTECYVRSSPALASLLAMCDRGEFDDGVAVLARLADLAAAPIERVHVEFVVARRNVIPYQGRKTFVRARLVDPILAIISPPANLAIVAERLAALAGIARPQFPPMLFDVDGTPLGKLDERLQFLADRDHTPPPFCYLAIHRGFDPTPKPADVPTMVLIELVRFERVAGGLKIADKGSAVEFLIGAIDTIRNDLAQAALCREWLAQKERTSTT